jgi:hypothetical protein
MPPTTAENFQRCVIERDALCLRKGDKPGRDVRQVLNVDSLRAFEAGHFRLEMVDVPSLFGVLGFEPIDLTGLGPELGLEYLPEPLAASCF